jgi:hypothetical protein
LKGIRGSGLSHFFVTLPVEEPGVGGDWDVELLLGVVDVDVVDVLVAVTTRVSLMMARSRRQ